MFTEILKIKPQLDEKDLKKMQNLLQGRFKKLAGQFGKGLVASLKGGGILGAGLALVDKILNPLKEVQDAIDNALKSSDDIATNAKQFDTSTGKLFKLVQIAKSTGLDQDNLFTLITKFQTAVAEARANPSEPAAVSQFTGQADTAESFFEFIQALQKMDKSQQLLVQQSVFGEKQILKMADFLQTDFAAQIKAIGLDKVSTDRLNSAVENTAAMNDLTDINAARLATKDALAKGELINKGIIDSRYRSSQIAQDRENARIKSYHDLAALSETSEKIISKVEEGVTLLGRFVTQAEPAMKSILNYMESFSKSKWLKGFFSKGKAE